MKLRARGALAGLSGLALLLGGCATGLDVTRSVHGVTLTGLQVVPGPGDPDGTGTAELRLNPAQAQLCWELYARDIGPATAAHVHRGAAGSAGPPVVPMTTPDAAGRSSGCAALDPTLAREIALQPYDYYVNVHSQAFPTGAIRGQLRGSGVRRPPARRPTGD